MTEREQPETPLRDVLSKLANFAQDLTAEAERGTLAPGARRTDIERIQHVLCRHVRNYPVLLAQPDVDVRGVVEGLAWEIAHIPSPLVGKRVIALDGKSISEALSDTERGPAIVRDGLSSALAIEGAVIFIDNLPALLEIDNLSTFKAAIAHGRGMLMGSATRESYEVQIAQDLRLRPRFQPIELAEATVSETIEVLKFARQTYEAHHWTSITDSALVAAAELADRYIQDQPLPEKALSLLDEACAYMRMRVKPPPDLHASLNAEIADVRESEELAIKDRHFDRLDSLRDEEQRLLAAKERAEMQWREQFAEEVLIEVDEEQIITVVERLTKVPVAELVSTLSDRSREPAGQSAPRQRADPKESGGPQYAGFVPTPNPKTVFVVHGRNDAARRAMFEFLRAIGLNPLEWSRALAATGSASPYIGEVLDAAFNMAQAIVVLMTPDEIAYLLPDHGHGEDDPETKPTHQARPNVLFEAGMAMGRDPKRTVLVELGKLRSFSDVGGRHLLRLDQSPQKRNELAQRLKTAGCDVDLDGNDWMKTGDFSPPGS